MSIPTCSNPLANAVCNPQFLDLPEAARIRVLGVNGECLNEFPCDSKGFVILDGRGGATVTQNINGFDDIPRLFNPLLDINQAPILDGDGEPMEDDPPEVPTIVVSTEAGDIRTLSGRKGTPGYFYWDGDQFVFHGMFDVGFTTTASVPTSAEGRMIVLDDSTPCDVTSGEAKSLKQWVPSSKGLVQVGIDGELGSLDLCGDADPDAEIELDYIIGCKDGELVAKPNTPETVTCSNPGFTADYLLATPTLAVDEWLNGDNHLGGNQGPKIGTIPIPSTLPHHDKIKHLILAIEFGSVSDISLHYYYFDLSVEGTHVFRQITDVNPHNAGGSTSESSTSQLTAPINSPDVSWSLEVKGYHQDAGDDTPTTTEGGYWKMKVYVKGAAYSLCDFNAGLLSAD